MPPNDIPVGSRYCLSVNDVYSCRVLPAREQHGMACQIRAVIMEVEMKLSNDLQCLRMYSVCTTANGSNFQETIDFHSSNTSLRFQEGSSAYRSLLPSSGVASKARLFPSSFATHNADPEAVVRRNNMLKTGISCSSNATVPNHVYLSRLFLINAFLSFFVKPSNLKYLQCCSGPARYPVRIKNIGVPATGIKLRGRKMMNSAICRNEKGE